MNEDNSRKSDLGLLYLNGTIFIGWHIVSPLDECVSDTSVVYVWYYIFCSADFPWKNEFPSSIRWRIQYIASIVFASQSCCCQVIPPAHTSYKEKDTYIEPQSNCNISLVGGPENRPTCICSLSNRMEREVHIEIDKRNENRNGIFRRECARRIFSIYHTIFAHK